MTKIFFFFFFKFLNCSGVNSVGGKRLENQPVYCDEKKIQVHNLDAVLLAMTD